VGLAEVLQQTPQADKAPPPSEVIDPPLMADVIVIADIVVVVTVGITIVGGLSSFLQDTNKIISRVFKINILFAFILLSYK
jgi:hypothetical protein